MTGQHGISTCGAAGPSTKISSGWIGRSPMARAIASRVACRMLRWSISSAQARPTPTWAHRRMHSKARSRWRAVSALESSMRTGRRARRDPHPWGSTTAAATTGPAHGPRPASSTPAISRKPAARAMDSGSRGGRWGRWGSRRGRLSRFGGGSWGLTGGDLRFSDFGPHVIEPGPPDFPPSEDFNPLDHRRVERKDSFHAFPMRHAPDGARLADPASSPADHQTFKRDLADAILFPDPAPHPHLIPRTKVGDCRRFLGHLSHAIHRVHCTDSFFSIRSGRCRHVLATAWSLRHVVTRPWAPSRNASGTAIPRNTAGRV